MPTSYKKGGMNYSLYITAYFSSYNYVGTGVLDCPPLKMKFNILFCIKKLRYNHYSRIGECFQLFLSFCFLTVHKMKNKHKRGQEYNTCSENYKYILNKARDQVAYKRDARYRQRIG